MIEFIKCINVNILCHFYSLYNSLDKKLLEEDHAVVSHLEEDLGLDLALDGDPVRVWPLVVPLDSLMIM